uniref:Tyr recombinase domain-containing protein n=1 Tax=Photinus pyralis TaxID=7054 RepID=A0A1Y1LDW4_PHOPY
MAVEVSLASLTKSSISQYNHGLKLWWDFCVGNKFDPFILNFNNILSFLSDLFNRGFSYSNLNTVRSALSLILSPEVGSDARIKRFFRGVFKLRPSSPKYKHTWDPTIVLSHLSTYYPNQDLSLEQLTRKLVTLLILITAHRVQTLSLIRVKNIILNEDKIQIRIPDRIKTSGPKSFQPILEIPFFHEKPALCVASTLQHYLGRTETLRTPMISNLFITFRKPHKTASTQSISRWIKSTLAECGIDTKIFTAHSTRHAATSMAARKGVSLDVIRNTAGWSASSRVFAQFYNRPVLEEQSVANAILGLL